MPATGITRWIKQSHQQVLVASLAAGALVASITIFASGPSNDGLDDVPFDTLTKDAPLGAPVAGTRVIADQSAYDAFAAENAWTANRPAVDFTMQQVIAAVSDTKPNGGYDLSISRIVDEGARVSVWLEAVSPGRDCINTTAETSPNHLVTVPLLSKPVIFTTTGLVRHCDGSGSDPDAAPSPGCLIPEGCPNRELSPIPTTTPTPVVDERGRIVPRAPIAASPTPAPASATASLNITYFEDADADGVRDDSELPLRFADGYGPLAVHCTSPGGGLLSSEDLAPDSLGAVTVALGEGNAPLPADCTVVTEVPGNFIPTTATRQELVVGDHQRADLAFGMRAANTPTAGPAFQIRAAVRSLPTPVQAAILGLLALLAAAALAGAGRTLPKLRHKR